MSKIKQIIKWNEFPAFILLVVAILINSILMGGVTTSFFKSFLTTNLPAVILAIAVGLTIIVGGTDISLGAIVSLVNVSVVSIYGLGYSPEIAVLCGIIISVLCGVINGIVIGKFRVNALLATFATSTVFSGIALWIMPFPSGSLPRVFSKVYLSLIFNLIPVPVVILAVILMLWYVMRRKKFGVQIYAIGNNVDKAYASGINVGLHKGLIHIYAGLLAGIAGLCVSANICAGSPSIGDTMSMSAIAAAVIGGISLSGGKGSIIGAIFGAMFLSIITSIVVSANLGSFVQSFVQGLIMLFGVLLAITGSNLRTRKNRKSDILVKANKE